jgi:hypothetical protein
MSAASNSTDKSLWKQLVAGQRDRMKHAQNYTVENIVKPPAPKFGPAYNKYKVSHGTSTHIVTCGVRRAPMLFRENATARVIGGKPHSRGLSQQVYVQTGAIVFKDNFGMLPVACDCNDFWYRGTLNRTNSQTVKSLAMIPAFGSCKHMYAVSDHIRNK